MIRAARQWGGDRSQGLAFGILDGGRGFVASAMAVVAVIMLAGFMPDDPNLASDAERLAGLRSIIIFYSASTLFAALLVWLLVPAMTPTAMEQRQTPWQGMLQVMRRPIAWTHALVIVAAYCGYKGLDNYSLYAVQVLGMDEVEAARFTAYAGYLRPLGCIIAGIVADRVGAALTTSVSFVLLIAIYGVLSIATPSASWTPIIFANLLISYLAVFAFRGLYYALLEETRTPKQLTGTTVGFIAFIGYTPDVFFGPVSGRILDAAPGLTGHQNFFLFLTVISIAGLIAVIALSALNRRASDP